MGLRTSGVVTYVETATRGSETSAAATAGDPVIVVANVADFTPAGGLIDIGQASSPVQYGSAVLDADGVTGTITLTEQLGADVDEGVRVDLWLRRGPSTRYIATVETGDGEVTADLPAHYALILGGGPRAENEREFVELERRRGKWYVIDAPLQPPAVDLGFADGTKPITPGAVVQTFAQHKADMAGAVPPSTFGDGATNADIEILGRQKSPGVEVTAQGTIARLPSGAGSLLIRPDGMVQYIGALGDFDDLVSRKATLAGPTTGAPGGVLTLQDAGLLDPPPQPPTQDSNWLTASLGSVVDTRDMFAFGVKSATLAFCMTRDSQGRVAFRTVNPTTPGPGAGVLVPSGAPTVATIISACYQSRDDMLQTLEYDATAGEWLVRYYDWASLNFDHEWVCTQLGSATSPQPVVASFCSGVDEYTRVLQSNPDGTVNIHRFHNEVFVTTSVTADAFVWGDSGSLDLVACATYGGMLLLAGRRNLIADDVMAGGDYEGKPVLPVIDMGFPGSGLAIGDTLGYLLVEYGDLMCAGLGVIDSDLTYRTWYVSLGQGLVAQQSNPVEAGGYWTLVEYLDSVTSNETGFDAALATLEVKIPGANVTYTIGQPPPGSAADSMRIYFARDLGAGVPARTDFWPQATSAPGEWHADVFTVLSSGTNPLATGTIPSGDPFEIRSGAGVLLLDGTGFVAGGGGGGTPLGGVDIDCGTASATGVQIDCGVA